MRNALLLALVVLVGPAGAHRPVGVPETTRIEDPTISWALEGRFETGNEVFVVKFDMPRDFALPFEILVPHRGKYAEFRPAFAVVGEGLFDPTPVELDALPREIPYGMGVYVDLNEVEERDVFFEGVFRRAYWSSGTTAVPLLAGDHEIWIWSPDGDTGPFLVGMGVEEDFGPLEDE